jgi:cytochrome c peroxidase
MKPPSATLFVILGACIFLLGFRISFAQETNIEPAALRTKALSYISPLPDKMPGAENDSPALVALGRELYFEKRLSQNESQSCNSCHPLENGHAGVDNQATSLGALGKRGTRNCPTTLNAGFHFVQFWDGRATNLQQQAEGPILNPVEMAMPDQKTAVERLKKDKRCLIRFAEAFPAESDPITFHNTTLAIASFERTLITHDRLDDFLKGQNSALTPGELKGLNTFLTIGCISCHYGPLLGGTSYRKIGIIKPYSNQSDVGRAAITMDDDDKFQFKVPSLRNVAETGPYFHDGRLATLSETVRTMAKLQLGRDLSKEQEHDLVIFLQCLTGKGIASDSTPNLRPKSSDLASSEKRVTAPGSRNNPLVNKSND